MKVVVIYYSRTGRTKRIAEELALVFGASVARIFDKKNRQGIGAYFKAGKDALFKKETQIETRPLINPQVYDLIFIGTPVWAGTMTPAIRTYLKNLKLKNKKIGFFCTTNVSGISNSLEEMSHLLGENQIVARIGFTAFNFRNFASIKERIKELKEKLL
jgi:flavodoxin